MSRHLYCIVLFLLCLQASPMHAEIIRGRFVDAETKEALEGVDLLCTGAYKRNGVDRIYATHIATDSLGQFLFFSNRNGKITAKLIGYYPKEMDYIAISDTDRDTLDLGDITLKVSEVMMKALLVKDRARRFTVRGDTIVFHPEAFHLEEGARLEELIAQLPGVVMDGSKLFFNGKPIRVVMNGERVFGNPDFYRQLPAEVVENIKAYNKASEFSERTGKDDGVEDMVLDLKIKKSFLDRFYGDANGAYQSPKHYDAEVTAQKLSESDPIMITVSANNLNKQRSRTMGSVSMKLSKDFGQQQYGAAGYQHNWRRTEAGQTLRSHWAVSGGMAHNDQRIRKRQDTENFFPDEAYNYTATSNYQRDHTLNPNAEVTYRHAINVRNTVQVSARFDHKRQRGHKEYRSALFGCNPYDVWKQPVAAAFDSVALSGLLLRDRTRSTSEGRTTTISTNASWTHYIKDGSLSVSTFFNYNESLLDNLTERRIEYVTEDSLPTTWHQYGHTPTNLMIADVKAKGQKWVRKNVLLNASYSLTNTHSKSTTDFFVNDVRNDANSYDERNLSNSHTFSAGSTINLNSLQLMPLLSWVATLEHLDYRRGRVDTTAVRNKGVWNPQLKAKWKITKTSTLELDYNLQTAKPTLIETIHYRDDSNPLWIREGNPDLSDTHTNDISLAYNAVNSKRQRTASLNLSFKNDDRAIRYAQTFNPQTAVYTIHPEMARGNRQGGLTFNLDQALGNEFRLTSNFALQYNLAYGYLTRTGETEPLQMNRSSSFIPSEYVMLSYDHVCLKCSAFASVAMNQLRYSQTPQQNTTLWNNRFGANITVELKHLTINSSLTDYLHSGYVIKSMDNNYLLWNASVTWKLSKNKAHLKLELNDILNQINTFYAQQGAYQNIYSWREQMHHYAAVSFTYHFDAKEKK